MPIGDEYNRSWGADYKMTYSTNTVNTVTGPYNLSNVMATHEHELNPEVATYLDGLIASECKTCQQRFTIEWFPGGTALIRAKRAIDEVFSCIERKEPISDYYRNEFAESIEWLKKDKIAIEETLEKLELVNRALVRDLLDD